MKYRLTLGNKEMRKGHRHDCGQIQVVIEIDAENEKEARKRVAGGGGTVVSHEVGLPTVINSAPIQQVG